MLWRGLAVHDLDVGEALYAAVALAHYGRRLRVMRLPVQGPEIEALTRRCAFGFTVDPRGPAGKRGASERSAAWLAHQSGGLGVGGSNPLAPTNLFNGLAEIKQPTENRSR